MANQHRLLQLPRSARCSSLSPRPVRSQGISVLSPKYTAPASFAPGCRYPSPTSANNKHLMILHFSSTSKLVVIRDFARHLPGSFALQVLTPQARHEPQIPSAHVMEKLEIQANCGGSSMVSIKFNMARCCWRELALTMMSYLPERSSASILFML